MMWADDPGTRRLWIVTMAFAVLLSILYCSFGSRKHPVQLQAEGRVSSPEVQECLMSPKAEQLLGKLSGIRIGVGSWLNRDTRLYRSTRGHVVAVHTDVGVTSLTVRSNESLSPNQKGLFTGCVTSPPSW
jgi:hypothetical protein